MVLGTAPRKSWIIEVIRVEFDDKWNYQIWLINTKILKMTGFLIWMKHARSIMIMDRD